jgi:putative flippase GtrA
VRFGMVSVVGIIITQALLVLFHGILDVDATVANVLAVTLSSVPVFLLNKRWVWGQADRPQLRRELLPFWGFTLLGLVLSTILVAIVDGQTDRTWPVMLANISGFGIVWVAKFVFLDAIVFGREVVDGG